MPARPEPLELVAAAWPGTGAAERAMHRFRVTLTPDLVGLTDAATLVVERDGTLRVTDTRHGGGVLGGVLGAGLGLLTGGIGWMWLHGPTLGPLVTRAVAGGLLGGALRALGERTTPGSSALLAVAEPTWATGIERALAEDGADLVRFVVPAHVAGRLEAAPPLAFDPAEHEGSVVAFRSTAPVMRVVDAVGSGARSST